MTVATLCGSKPTIGQVLVMRCATAAIALVLSASSLHAQSLTIGGVAVRLGESIRVAVASLNENLPKPFRVAPVYLRHLPSLEVDSTSEWIVSKNTSGGSGPGWTAATLSVKDSVISYIAKYYDLGDGSDIADAYTAAMRDARTEPFEPCTTAPVKLSLSRPTIEIIRTVCGRYELDFGLSWKASDGPAHSSTSIAVILGAHPPQR